MLRLGSVSKQVTRWQIFLGLAADGIFGPKTEKATKAWQQANGLKADGIVGPNTEKLAQTKGYKDTPAGGDYYPPRPNFGSPGGQMREALFGKFGWKPSGPVEIQILGDWVRENIVEVQIPQLVGVPSAPADGVIRFHKYGQRAIKGLFAEVEAKGLLPLVISWAGSFYPRRIRGGKALSNHSWGTAFDINAWENWLGKEPAKMGQRGYLLPIVPIANKYGFFWGGHYEHRKDGMHFELARLKDF